jgi:hypothetical protein
MAIIAITAARSNTAAAINAVSHLFFAIQVFADIIFLLF